MREIKLTGKRGGIAWVDEEDFQEVNKFSWYNDGRYAVRKPKSGMVYMHRFILKPKQLQVDHINRNKLDNRRANLREVSCSINLRNKDVNSKTESGVKGVYPNGRGWLCRITHNKKQTYLGTFSTIDEASRIAEDFYRGLPS